MKTTKITYLLLLVLFSSCENQRHDRFMTELNCPVVLIGKTGKAVANPSIVVRDGAGEVRTLSSEGGGGWGMPAAIADSRNIGDTLKSCN